MTETIWTKCRDWAWDTFSVVTIIVGCAIVFLAVGFLWSECGRKSAVQSERAKAVEAGVGRYVVNPETGEMDFEYGGKP